MHAPISPQQIPRMCNIVLGNKAFSDSDSDSEDVAKLRSHILMSIQSENVFLCSESILPRSYETVEQAIHTLVAQEEIPRHGKPTFNYKDSKIN